MSGKGKKNRKGLETGVIVAMIGLVGTLLVALLNSTAIQTWWNNKLNSTPVPTTQPANLVTATPTELVMASPTFFVSETPPTVEVLPPASTLGTMNAQLVYNYSTGKAPLQVTFNAHSSFLRLADGTNEACEFSNVCSYTWEVRQGSTPLFVTEENNGKFAYTFQKKGEYTVLVNVCRGNVCGFTFAGIDVK